MAASLALLSARAAAAQTTTIGEQLLTPSLAPSAVEAGQDIPWFQEAAGTGYVSRVPHSGSITDWRFLSSGIATGKHFVLRVLEPAGAGGKVWRAVATSPQAAVTSETGADAVNGPFSASLPVAAGDAIALEATDGSELPGAEGSIGVDGVGYFPSAFADGETAEQTAESAVDKGQIVPIQATLEYPSTVSTTTSMPTASSPTNLVPPTIAGAGGNGGSVSAGQALQCGVGSWTGSPALAVGWFMQTGAGRSRSLTGAQPLGTGASLQLPSLPPGRKIYCQVTASAGGFVSLATSATLTVQAIKPALQSGGLSGSGAIPLIVRRVAPGDLESCSTGIWQNYPSAFKYQWLLRAPRGLAAHARGRLVAQGPVVKMRKAYAGSDLICRVTAVNEAGSVSVNSRPAIVPKLSVPLVPVSCGHRVSTGKVDQGCPGAAIKVIMPGQLTGHAVNPTSTAQAPLLTNAHPPAEPEVGRYLLECEPPKFNQKVKLRYRWSLIQLEFFTYGRDSEWVPNGVPASSRVLDGHFVTIDHGVLDQPSTDLLYDGWRETTSDDGGRELESALQLGPQVLMVTCEALGSNGLTSDRGRSPALDIEGTPGSFGSEDRGVVGQIK